MKHFSLFVSKVVIIVLITGAIYSSWFTYKLITGEYKKELPGDEIYNAIEKSKKKTKIKRLILGDSTGFQLFNNYDPDDVFYSLACNQAISVAGQYFLLLNFLNSGNHPECVYMIFNPFGLKNNLDQKFTYHYFIKPFYTSEYKPLMTNTVQQQIEKIPYYWASQIPNIKASTWAPTYKTPDNPQDSVLFMSQISREYLNKIDSLSQVHSFRLIIYPTFASEANKQRINNLRGEDLNDITCSSQFCNFFDNITFFDDSLFVDGLHLKEPEIFIPIYKKKLLSL